MDFVRSTYGSVVARSVFTPSGSPTLVASGSVAGGESYSGVMFHVPQNSAGAVLLYLRNQSTGAAPSFTQNDAHYRIPQGGSVILPVNNTVEVWALDEPGGLGTYRINATFLS